MPVVRITQNTFFKRSTLSADTLPAQDKINVRRGQTFDARYIFRVGNHCFVELANSLSPVGRVGYFFLPHVQVTMQELRAVWLTLTDSKVLHSRSNLEQALQALSQLGFNTIYPNVWSRGFTLFPSAIAKEFTGSEVMPDANFNQRDMLAELIEVAKPFNFRVIPWFEYGLKTLVNTPIATRNRHLITADPQGNTVQGGAVWLNPTHPEVQQFMVDLVRDVAARYDVAGVQLDDNFGLPVELGYDSFTRALYRQENQEQPMPLNPRDPKRLQWLTDKITVLFQRIFNGVKAQKACLISLSPNPLEFSRRNYAMDWRLWEQDGFVEELVPQIYRENLAIFTVEIDKPELVDARFHIPTAIGVLTGLNGKTVSFSQLREQVQMTRQRQFAGGSCFFYETLFNETLSPKVPRNPADLRSLFPVQPG